MNSNRFSYLWQQLQKISKYLVLFSICFALTVGCSNNQTQKNASNNLDSNRISVGTTLKPRTLDPADNYELAGLNIIYNVGESLYTYQVGTTEIKPLLAKAMPKISDDNLTYTIPLREGVTFHDGAAFNAEAMAFSLQRFIQNGGKPAFLLGDVIDTVEATGEYELTISIKQPFAALTALLAFPGLLVYLPSNSH